ncbi:acyltransferase family protein [Burkholderia pseudomallei 305]|nr:hypothetical protein BPC006_I2598 [Burkholderia pseudomallei BPC006]EBA50836.1 acyltransferase family protein [Burkholderia pseudomallei 305]EEH24964.1 hypothetical protein BUH_2543 [Burkholderia pseudomallei Pakistan 9]
MHDGVRRSARRSARRARRRCQRNRAEKSNARHTAAHACTAKKRSGPIPAMPLERRMAAHGRSAMTNGPRPADVGRHIET